MYIRIRNTYTVLVLRSHEDSNQSHMFDGEQKIENRVSSDMDLKLSDSLRYYVRDTEAGKTLLYKRFRSLADLNEANKKVERARAKGRDVPQVSALVQLTLYC